MFKINFENKNIQRFIVHFSDAFSWSLFLRNKITNPTHSCFPGDIKKGHVYIAFNRFFLKANLCRVELFSEPKIKGLGFPCHTQRTIGFKVVFIKEHMRNDYVTHLSVLLCVFGYVFIESPLQTVYDIMAVFIGIIPLLLPHLSSAKDLVYQSM